MAEFRRDGDELAEHSEHRGWQQYVTARGGIGLRTERYALPVAYETLASDGQSWGHALTFYLPARAETRAGVVVCKGTDEQPLQRSAGTALLFDLGVGGGAVSLSVRTADPALIHALRAVEGKDLFGAEGTAARTLLLQISPPRVAVSPLGRIEVYARIPGPGEQSPAGPHTHLLPKLLASGRLHSANAPIPAGLQSVLTLHPPSAWHNVQGRRTVFNERADERFQALFKRFGLPEDKAVRSWTEAAVLGGAHPATYPWPATRRGRIQARIMLRRLAQRLGAERLQAWRSRFDRGGPQDDVTDEDVERQDGTAP